MILERQKNAKRNVMQGGINKLVNLFVIWLRNCMQK